MGIDDLLRQNGEQIRRIAALHGAGNLRLFGSAARSEAGPDSDLDILVDVVSTPSSWFPAGLILDLQALLGRRVDVVAEKGLDPALRQRVLREAVPL
jgi:predicted nucleotidyltransferase